MKALNTLYRALRYIRITKSPRKLAFLARYPDVDTHLISENNIGTLIISGTDVGIESSEREFLLRGLGFLKDLVQKAGARIGCAEDGGVILTVAGVNLRLECWEELFIAHEVFCRLTYNIGICGPFEVIDVGMNTGTSALFFAAMPNCEQVSAFELFEPTARRAEANFDLNPALSKKIKAFSFGLGAKDENLTLDYCAELKGSLGRNGLPDYAAQKGPPLAFSKVPVTIKNAVPIFKQLLTDAGSRPTVCKLDCEGAEYEIIRTLHGAGALSEINALLIEWHLKGPGDLKHILEDAGFCCLSFDDHASTHGMLYAFQQYRRS
jgi:FkbM family methyltransferase